MEKKDQALEESKSQGKEQEQEKGSEMKKKDRELEDSKSQGKEPEPEKGGEMKKTKSWKKVKVKGWGRSKSQRRQVRWR